VTPRRLLTLTAVLIFASFISLLTYGLLSAGSTGTLARDIAEGKRPRVPSINLALLYPPRRGWQQRDRGILADSRVQTSELLQVPTLINFWASWCVPCGQEAAVLEQAAAGHPRVRFIGINVRDGNYDALAFLRHYQTSYPNVDDPSDQAWRAFQLTGVPESFLIDATGHVAYHQNGPFTESSIERALRHVTR
jgi:thiol-disulfide isomerase/thioredoxin